MGKEIWEATPFPPSPPYNKIYQTIKQEQTNKRKRKKMRNTNCSDGVSKTCENENIFIKSSLFPPLTNKIHEVWEDCSAKFDDDVSSISSISVLVSMTKNGIENSTRRTIIAKKEMLFLWNFSFQNNLPEQTSSHLDAKFSYHKLLLDFGEQV